MMIYLIEYVKQSWVCPRKRDPKDVMLLRLFAIERASHITFLLHILCSSSVAVFVIIRGMLYKTAVCIVTTNASIFLYPFF